MLSHLSILIFCLPLLVTSSFLQGDKIVCKEEGKIIKFAFLEQDPCILCKCRNGTVDCFKNHCEIQNILQISKSSPKIVELTKHRCVHNSRSYQNSQTWIESCRRCTCTDGQVKCLSTRAESCPQQKTLSCPAGQELREHSSPDCCPKCVPAMLNTSPSISQVKFPTKAKINYFAALESNSSKSRICSLNQNRKIQTFDGRDYPLIGKCNYAFVRDCSTDAPKKAIQPYI